MDNVIAVIPARYDSTRFPGKPLASILGKPMIQWVYESVVKSEKVKAVFVATDDERIESGVESFGGKVIMTGKCSCGTERVYEASKAIDADIVINVQGDEPMIKAEMIEQLIAAFEDKSVYMATLKKKISSIQDIQSSNVVKVITDIHGDAVYFSRSKIPFNRDDNVTYYKHIGVYGYKKDFLKTVANLPISAIEKAEQLEQLRVIENGYKIRVEETAFESVGVDVLGNVKQVESMMLEMISQ